MACIPIQNTSGISSRAFVSVVVYWLLSVLIGLVETGISDRLFLSILSMLGPTILAGGVSVLLIIAVKC